MAQLLEKLIPQILTTIKLRHPATPGAPHRHTSAVVVQDETGQHWLEAKCRHDKCPGMVRKKIPEWLAREWGAE